MAKWLCPVNLTGVWPRRRCRHEMHGTMEVSHRFRLDWPNPQDRPVVAGRVPFGWKIDTFDMESRR